MTATLARPRSSAAARTAALPFAKYHGAGNDFVIVDGRSTGMPEGEAGWATLARQMCDRHFGIGADGLLVASDSALPAVPVRMRMYNPDGSESEMCGNGLRCFVRWLYERAEVTAGSLPVETGAGVLRADVKGDGTITVDMGRPRLAPAEIPLSSEAIADQPGVGPALHLPLRLPGVALDVTCVSMGNPHAVAFLPDVAGTPLEQWGPLVEHHSTFPAGTNFEVVQVADRQRLKMRVWERGAGITLACGTGACASVVAARLRGLVDDRVAVEVPGGTLHVEWRGGDDTVSLSGPVAHVFDGSWPCVQPPES